MDPILRMDDYYLDPNDKSKRLPLSKDVQNVLDSQNFTDKTRVSYDNDATNNETDNIDLWGVPRCVPATGIMSTIEKRYLDAYYFMKHNPNVNFNQLDTLTKKSVEDKDTEMGEFQEEIKNSSSKFDDSLFASPPDYDAINAEIAEQPDTTEDGDDLLPPYDRIFEDSTSYLERDHSESEEPESIKSEIKSDTHKLNSKLIEDEIEVLVKKDDESALSRSEIENLIGSSEESEFEQDDEDSDTMLSNTYPFFEHINGKGISVCDIRTNFLNKLDYDENGTEKKTRIAFPPSLLQILDFAGTTIYSERVWRYIEKSSLQLKVYLSIYALAIQGGTLSPKLFKLYILDAVIHRINKPTTKKNYESCGSYKEVLKSPLFKNHHDLKTLLVVLHSKYPTPLNSAISEDATLRRMETYMRKLLYIETATFNGIFKDEVSEILDDTVGVSHTINEIDKRMPDILASEQTRLRTNKLKNRY